MLEKQSTISKSHLAAARAVDQLRRQLAIVFEQDNGQAIGACPIEGLTNTLPGQRHLLLTGARARSLGLAAKDTRAVQIDAEKLTLAQLQALADPLSDVAVPEVKCTAATPSQEMLLTLAKYASLLPAMLTVEGTALPQDWVRVSLSDVKEYWSAPALDIVPLAKAQLPIEGAEQATLICLRERYGTSVHLAMVFGDIAKDSAPLTRVHSSCITGDILGSLRCDCGDQLKLALQQISTAGSGILLYLHQEGRGIGIANKLRAYQLQERGVDTYEANLMLGFDEDERDFSMAAAILKTLAVKQVRLLTNNPQKIKAVEKTGISVTERVPLIAKSGKHNQGYLDAKAKKSGHLF